MTITASPEASGYVIGGLVGGFDQATNDPDDGERFSSIDDCAVRATITAPDHPGFLGGMVGRVLVGTNSGRLDVMDSTVARLSVTTVGGQG